MEIRIHGRVGRLDEPGGALDIPGGQRKTDRLGRQVVLLAPQACPPAQKRDLAGQLGQRMGEEHLGEEVVIAEPVTLSVERDDEQVGALEGLQHGRAAHAAGDGIAERSAQLLENGGLQQEVPDRFRLSPQHFFDEVIQHKTVAARERLDEAGRIRVALHGKRGQLQAGDPALGPRFQRGDIVRGELQTHRLVEKLSGFARAEAQVGGAQFGQLSTGAQAGQGKLRILAGRNDQMHLGGQMLEQKGERVVNSPGINQMIVVKDEDEGILDGGDVIQQRCQNRFGGWRLGGLEPRRRARPDFRRNPFARLQVKRLQSRDEVGQEAGGIGVPFIQ